MVELMTWKREGHTWEISRQLAEMISSVEDGALGDESWEGAMAFMAECSLAKVGKCHYLYEGNRQALRKKLSLHMAWRAINKEPEGLDQFPKVGDALSWTNRRP
jgi:hypothetical protein